MISKAKMLMVLAAAAFFAPAANAATVNFDVAIGSNSVSDEIVPGGNFSFVFTFLERLRVYDISVSATGSGPTTQSAVDDVAGVTFGFDVPTNSFAVTGNMNSASGEGLLPGGVFMAGDTLTIVFEDGINNPVTIGLSFWAAPVPLPATALLLAPVLAAGGVVAMRRRKAGQTEA